MSKTLKTIIFLSALILTAFLTLNPNTTDLQNQTTHRGKVLQVSDQTIESQTLEIQLPSDIITINHEQYFEAHPKLFAPGDEIIVIYDQNQQLYYIQDHVRTPQLIHLFLLFTLAVFLVTGRQGLNALIGMGFSFIIIFKILLPLIIAGYSPVWVTIGVSLIIIPLTFYPSHGFNRKTNIAIFSTFLTLLTAGILAAIFAEHTHLTGLDSEEANFLSLDTAKNINFKGLILSGILISILGILDDITISQASTVQQLKQSKPHITFSELFKRAMTVGKDHISSLVNTLILVYAGVSLPLLMLFIDQSANFQAVINLEFMAEEIVRTLIGSIALILAVPITTLIAAKYTDKNSKSTSSHPH